jgi:hypothetical protein
MRANGGVVSGKPADDEDPLYAASRYILQNALVDQYFILTKSMLPKNSPSNIKSWYSLDTKKETALTRIFKKALGNMDLGVEECKNLFAELWSLMVSKLPKFFIQHDSVPDAYALDLDQTLITEDPVMYQCPECNRTIPHHIGSYCSSSTCFGKVEVLDQAHIHELYGYQRTISFPKLGMRTVEHTAQLELSELTQN